MNVKKCSKCGWEYPANWPGRICMFCKGKILNGYCAKCGIWSDKLGNDNLCTKCSTMYDMAWRMNKEDTAIETFEAWQKRVSRLVNYHTLTETEWLEACRYFGGCAYCGKDEIEAREMFIKFKDGGRYCAWNMLPTCEKCATSIKRITNPFLLMDKTRLTTRRKLGYSENNLQRIVDYLTAQIERAEKEANKYER